MSSSRYHDDLMSGYYCAREAQEVAAEAYSNGYETELKEFYNFTPRLTFKVWLSNYNEKEQYYNG